MMRVFSSEFIDVFLGTNIFCELSKCFFEFLYLYYYELLLNASLGMFFKQTTMIKETQ